MVRSFRAPLRPPLRLSPDDQQKLIMMDWGQYVDIESSVEREEPLEADFWGDAERESKTPARKTRRIDPCEEADDPHHRTLARKGRSGSFYRRCLGGRRRQHEVQPLPGSAKGEGQSVKGQSAKCTSAKSEGRSKAAAAAAAGAAATATPQEEEAVALEVIAPEDAVRFLVAMHPRALHDQACADRLGKQFLGAPPSKQRVVLAAAVRAARAQGREALLEDFGLSSSL